MQGVPYSSFSRLTRYGSRSPDRSADASMPPNFWATSKSPARDVSSRRKLPAAEAVAESGSSWDASNFTTHKACEEKFSELSRKSFAASSTAPGERDSFSALIDSNCSQTRDALPWCNSTFSLNKASRSRDCRSATYSANGVAGFANEAARAKKKSCGVPRSTGVAVVPVPREQ
mgnify:CR=1 FL=1